MWLYGSGFPKSMNIGLAIDKKNGVESKVVGEADFPDITGSNYENNDGSRIIVQQKEAQNEWNGWGTALKPAYEPIIVARKPCEGSCVDNVLRYGVGGINIDGCRVGNDLIKGGTMPVMGSGEQDICEFQTIGADRAEGADHFGRFPSNVILTYDDTDFQEVCGGFPDTKSTFSMPNDDKTTSEMNVPFADHKSGWHYDDSGNACRYFYTAKASKKDRDEGLEEFAYSQTTDGNIRRNEEFAPNIRAVSSLRRNTHPTVKPCDLMQYLIRLVTPPQWHDIRSV